MTVQRIPTGPFIDGILNKYAVLKTAHAKLKKVALKLRKQNAQLKKRVLELEAKTGKPNPEIHDA